MVCVSGCGVWWGGVGGKISFVRTYLRRYSKIAVSWKICEYVIQLRPQIFSD